MPSPGWKFSAERNCITTIWDVDWKYENTEYSNTIWKYENTEYSNTNYGSLEICKMEIGEHGKCENHKKL